MPFKDPERRRAYHAAYSREWGKRNRKRVAAATARWRAKNPDAGSAYYRANRKKLLRRMRELYWADPEKKLARGRRWHRRNRGRVREQKRRWAAANTEKRRGYTRKWQRAHPDAHRIHEQKRRALKRKATIGRVTAAAFAKKCARFAHRCAYCGKRRKLTMDHVVPLAAGGPHAMSNIVPACKPCNSQKCAIPAAEFKRRIRAKQPR